MTTGGRAATGTLEEQRTRTSVVPVDVVRVVGMAAPHVVDVRGARRYGAAREPVVDRRFVEEELGRSRDARLADAQSWRWDAACAGDDRFLSDNDTERHAAQQLCSSCPVLAECEEFAAGKLWFGCVVAGRRFLATATPFERGLSADVDPMPRAVPRGGAA